MLSLSDAFPFSSVGWPASAFGCSCCVCAVTCDLFPLSWLLLSLIRLLFSFWFSSLSAVSLAVSPPSSIIFPVFVQGCRVGGSCSRPFLSIFGFVCLFPASAIGSFVDVLDFVGSVGGVFFFLMLFLFRLSLSWSPPAASSSSIFQVIDPKCLVLEAIAQLMHVVVPMGSSSVLLASLV